MDGAQAEDERMTSAKATTDTSPRRMLVTGPVSPLQPSGCDILERSWNCDDLCPT